MMKNAKREQDGFLRDLYFTGESKVDPLLLMKYGWFRDLLDRKQLIVLEEHCRIHPTEGCLDYIEKLLGIDPNAIEA